MQSRYVAIAIIVVAVAAVAGLLMVGFNAPSSQAPAIGSAGSAGSAATVAVVSVSAPANVASAADAASAAGPRTVRWSSSNFPAGATVNVNLLRKVNDQPVSYEFVREIAANVSNNGQATWTPSADELGDNGGDLYIEVVCADPASFSGGCSATAAPVKAL